MSTKILPYFQLLNNYRRFIGLGKVGGLLSSILLSKAGLRPQMESLRVMQRWEFFQRLSRERSIQPLVIGEHEFRVGYGESLSNDGKVEVALRVPFCDSSDTEVFDQTFIKKEYMQVLKWFSSIYPEGKIGTIMDVGANIGCTALFLCIQFPTASIFCLEPEESNYTRLQLNVSLNRQKKIKHFRGGSVHSAGQTKAVEGF
jgi:hypothetical protein